MFRKRGVDVQLILKKDNAETDEVYKNGDADGLFAVFSDLISFHAQGIPAKVVYAADYSVEGDVIIGRPELKSPADLKGRPVSFSGVNTFSHMFVWKILAGSGLREVDMRFENISPMDVLDALEEGRIDAGHTWEPVKTRAVDKGYKIVARAGDFPGLIADVLAFQPRIIEERPEEIQRIVDSLFEARDFLFSHREEAVKIMAGAEGMAPEEMEEGIRGVRLLDAKENAEALKDSREMVSLYHSGKMIVEFLVNRGQLSRKPDMEAIIEPKFVKELKIENRQLSIVNHKWP